MCLRTAGAELRVEEASSHGRADMIVKTGGRIFVVEFKMAERAHDAEAALDAAIDQMRDRGYADKYRDCGKPIHLIDVAGGLEARNLLDILVKKG